MMNKLNEPMEPVSAQVSKRTKRILLTVSGPRKLSIKIREILDEWVRLYLIETPEPEEIPIVPNEEKVVVNEPEPVAEFPTVDERGNQNIHSS